MINKMYSYTFIASNFIQNILEKSYKLLKYIILFESINNTKILL